MTYVYADQTAVLGALATFAEPHTYDLCAEHAERLTAPRGWDVVRLVTNFEDVPERSDDLLAVADALRDRSVRDQVANRRSDDAAGADLPAAATGGPRLERPTGRGADGAPLDGPQEGERRGHLRVLRDVQARSAER